MQHIGHNLRELRVKRNYTQEYVAQKMSMSQTTSSHIESDPNHPVNDNEITKFAEILKTTEDEIKKVPPYVSIHNNDIKGNGYVHHLTNNGVEATQPTRRKMDGHTVGYAKTVSRFFE